MGSVTPQAEEYPPSVSLARDVYRPFPTLPANLPTEVDAPGLVAGALHSLASALEANDVGAVKACFLSSQAYWRDLLAFTWHIRTVNDASAIAPALLHLKGQRSWAGGFALDASSVKDATISPQLRWLEAMFAFETGNPAARCGGRVTLLPEEGPDGVLWKIWALSTWVDELKDFPEDVGGLKAPGRKLEDEETIDTDVFILGGGNAGIILAARLKALGLDHVVVDKNPQPGDNWALRYDCMRFHIGRHSCETPYLHYPDHLPVILTREDLADHMKTYAATFHLNMLNSSVVEGSSFDKSKGIWTIKVHTPWGSKVVKAKHLVQATGVGGSKPYIPSIPGVESYKGLNLHSVEYKNSRKTLSDKGAKSVIIVGSANSAFDIMEDCAVNGLATSMVARSPTYLFPWEYALEPEGLGAYALRDVDLVDKLQMTGPASIGGQLVIGMYQFLAEKEPDRYTPLAKAGFPVYDSVGGRGDLVHHLMERGGGHFNDIGDGVELIVNGTVKVVANVEPVAYTESGLTFSDGRTVDADAIVWCTGFKDRDRSVTAEVLGGKTFVTDGDRASGGSGGEVLGPHDVAARRDAIWGVDKEGELRGVFKRQLRLDNYWIFGGTTSHHRYYSKHLALQIKACVEGILPEAYRDTPEVA